MASMKASSKTGHVQFDSVIIYEFEVDIGDNPACREGCPISLGPDLLWQSKVDLNIYEHERGHRGRGKDLYIDVTERAGILLSKGYTLEDIVAVVLQMEEIKKSRSESLKMNNKEKLVMAIDSAGRTLRKIVVGNAKRQGPNSIQARMA